MGSDETTVLLDTKDLDRLIRAVAGNTASIRIGVLDTGRSDGKTNAIVGMAHEFGTAKMPRRSFLQDPLTNEFPKYVEQSGVFDEDLVKKVIATGSIKSWLEAIAKEAKRCVLDAFKTSGFGRWAPWSKNYRSATGLILNDTEQLKDSIDTEVRA